MWNKLGECIFRPSFLCRKSPFTERKPTQIILVSEGLTNALLVNPS